MDGNEPCHLVNPDRTTSPCLSMRSNQSMDRPIAFTDRMCSPLTSTKSDRTPSPCLSLNSDQSMDRPIAFKQQTHPSGFRIKHERITSPAPSCVSMKSDHSMDRPIAFSEGAEPQKIPSPCLSLRSDQSMDRPIAFRDKMLSPLTGHQLEQSVSPSSGYLSLQSDQSKDRPVAYCKGLPRLTSPDPSLISMKSHQSMDRPIAFSVERVKLGKTPSPCPSLRSDQSMDRPIAFRQEVYSPEISDLTASLLTEGHFRCSVCTEMLKNPVSIPCGHSYCRTCIETYWDKPDQTGGYACPQCRKRSRTRPVLYTNSVLALVVQKLQQAGFSPALPAHCYAGPGDVACDFCTERKLKAVKSCLTCIVSFCENHVRQHYTVPALQRHSLVEVNENLEQKVCRQHQRSLEVFCKTDQVFICRSCALEEHKRHDIIYPKKEDNVTPTLNQDQTYTTVRREAKLEKEIMDLQGEITVLAQKNGLLEETLKKTTDELSYQTKRFCRGPEEGVTIDWATDYTEVAALGRPLNLGMLYDCHNDSFISDQFLWDENVLSSMRLSIPRPHTDVKVLLGDSMKERFKALDMSPPLRASVLSGLVEVGGAAGYLKHTPQSQHHNRAILHYRKTTRLDILSQRLLQDQAPLPLITHKKATHVVMAALYGTQTFFVFEKEYSIGHENSELQNVIKKMTLKSTAVDVISSLTNSEKLTSSLYNCTLYSDVDDFEISVRFDSALKFYESLQNGFVPEGDKTMPLKIWLYPLRNLDMTCSGIVKEISDDLLHRSENVLEHLRNKIQMCQDVLNNYSNHSVMTWFPVLKKKLTQFSQLLQQYHSWFQRALATSIQTIRERGEEGEETLGDLVSRNDQSPFSPQSVQQWIQNKQTEMKALNECRILNITIVKSQEELNHIITDPEIDRVLCFAFTSLETKDPFLQALKYYFGLVNRGSDITPDYVSTTTTQWLLQLKHTSQKILSNLQLFSISKKTKGDSEKTKFIAASIPDNTFPGSSIQLYQEGSIVSPNIQLGSKPDPAETVEINQTSVTLKVQKTQPVEAVTYRVEYRHVSSGGDDAFSAVSWFSMSLPVSEEPFKLTGLKAATHYQFRYSVIDRHSMSDVSSITECQTKPRPKPGQTIVTRFNSETFRVSWIKAETEVCSPVLYYVVEFKEAGFEGWSSKQTEGPQCECTVTFPHSTCYRVRVSAVYGEGDTSEPSEETDVPVDVWHIDLFKTNTSLFLEALKLQTVKKPVKLIDWSDEKSEVRSFLQCLPYISQLRLENYNGVLEEVQAFAGLLCKTAECERQTGEKTLELLTSVCSYSSFPFSDTDISKQSDFLLDLYSHVKNYETQTGKSVLPALQSVYQSAPAVWNIDLSKRKASLFLEVLELQRVKKPVELRGWSDEESEVKSFLQCLQYVSQLSFTPPHNQRESSEEREKRVRSFILDLCLQAALCQSETLQTTIKTLLSYVKYEERDFLLDLYSHVKDYETETGRSVLPALQPVYQSAPAVWNIDLSKRKASLFLEVLKLQTVKKPLELKGWSDEEGEVKSFLQCLQYVSQLSFAPPHNQRESSEEWEKRVRSFILDLCLQAALCQRETLQTTIDTLLSYVQYEECDFLLDLYSHVMDYETQTGRSVLPALQPVYQSAPAVWNIDLSERKASLFLEVLKLQTVRKPVELRGWSVEESEVRSFFQCLPYILKLKFLPFREVSKEAQFLADLFHAAAECERQTGEKTLELLTSVCTYSSYTFSVTQCSEQCDFLLDLYSQLKYLETQTGKSVIAAFQSVYQSAPAVLNIDLSKRKASLFLEVLKLQRAKKPVKLRGWSDEESEVRSFLQCLQYVSQLRLENYDGVLEEVQPFAGLLCKAVECERQTGEKTLELLTSVCSYSSFPFSDTDDSKQSDFLLDLYSHVKDYETQTGRSVLPALQPVYQSAPAVWYIDLSKRKASFFLEVLKLQTEKKPVELIDWSDEESEVRSFLQCLQYISQLRLENYDGVLEEVQPFAGLLCKAVECERQTGEKTLELLTSVCSYSSFPFSETDDSEQSDFLLDLYSHVRDYETQTGRSVLPALQPVYQSVPAVWNIDLSKRKASLFLEVLKLQRVKKPVELRGLSDEEGEERSFLQCLSYISELSFIPPHNQRESSEEWEKRVRSFILDLCLQAALCQRETLQTTVKMLLSCVKHEKSDFLLDLYSHVKDYETQTGRSVLPALQPVYQSAPAVWKIDLSERKASLFLEVLKLQREKEPVELRDWSDEESEVRSFLQCLPYISELRFGEDKEFEDRESIMTFMLKLFATAAECVIYPGDTFPEPLVSILKTLLSTDEYYYDYDYEYRDHLLIEQSDFLLDLYSHVKDYETQTGRSVLPALQPLYQSAPAVWKIDLSERKASLFLEVLKLQTQKKPVELRDWSDDESEVRSFLQCLPYISQLRLYVDDEEEKRMMKRRKNAAIQFLLNLSVAAADCDTDTGENFSELLASHLKTSLFYSNHDDEDNFDDDNYSFDQSDFLLDLYSHVKDYETQTDRSVLPALQPVYQSAPAVWNIDLSERKASIFLEVLKLQTEKKPVELRDWSDEESEVRSFLQCLPYISQLRFYYVEVPEQVQLLADLFYKAAECERQTGEKTLELLTSVCSYSSFPYGGTHSSKQSDFLLDLYSHVKDHETQTGRSVLPALQLVYQSAPAVWYIDLSKRKASLFLEVLKLQRVKKLVELRGCSDEESEVRSFLQCLPYISQLRLDNYSEVPEQVRLLADLFCKAVECERQTGEKTLELLTSVCSYSSFPYGGTHSSKQSDFLLDLYSHVKDHETQTGRSVLPALQPVYQSAPAVWNIDLSKRKASIFLEVLKLQTEKKPVQLRGCSDEESEVRSFLQCLPYVSQLRLDSDNSGNANKQTQSLVDLFCKAAECERQTGEKTLELLTSVCSYSSFPFSVTQRSKQSDFLLDLYSHVKDYETQTGSSVLPALQPVYQSAPAVWNIDLSKRKTSLFLEVLKLHREKKPVKLRGWSDEQSEVRSFLQCLPYISELRFDPVANSLKLVQFLTHLFCKAVECERQTGEKTLELLTSVCSYSSFPLSETHNSKQCDFLLDLYSHLKDYETQTGSSVLPALQPVYQSAPAVWNIDLSKRKASLFLEVLKLQREKKPVKLRGFSNEESEVRSLFQCLPYILTLKILSEAEQCVVSLCKVVRTREETQQVTSLLQALDFTLTLGGRLPSDTCRAVGRVLGLSASRLNLTLNPQSISPRGVRRLFRNITHLHRLSLSGRMTVRMVRALRSVRGHAPVTIEELSLVLTQQSEGELSRVLSSLASLLRLWTVQCLDLTECSIKSHSLIVLLCHQGPLAIRLSRRNLRQLITLVYEAQEVELTRSFLEKVGGDLTSCSLTWEMLRCLLQDQTQRVTVDFKKTDIPHQNIRELLPLLDRVQFRGLSSSFVMSIIREIYETRSAHCVSSLLSSVENYINLSTRVLDTVDCAALCFTLQHSKGVRLNLLWTSIPEGAIENILPFLNTISHLSVDRRLLLRLLHCCCMNSELQQGAAAALLRALQHTLDFSCCSAVDLSTESEGKTLHLSPEHCRLISMAIQSSDINTHLNLQDCDIQDAGLNELFPILHKIRLSCSKNLLLQFLTLVCVGTESGSVKCAVALSQALGDEVDFSETRLDLQACRSLALVLEHSDGLSELDLSHCQLTDHCLELLLPHLHKAQVLDLSHNEITDCVSEGICSMVSTNNNIQTVRLFNNRIRNRKPFLTNRHFEIW